MTVYGPGCTEREPVTILVNKPRWYSDLEIEYYAAIETNDNNWKMYDALIEQGSEQDHIEEKFDECQRFEKHMISLKRQLHCAHDMNPVGGHRLIGGGWFDNPDEICQQCGVLKSKTIKRTHVSIIADIEASERL